MGNAGHEDKELEDTLDENNNTNIEPEGIEKRAGKNNDQ
jgi:hypothetical protein